MIIDAASRFAGSPRKTRPYVVAEGGITVEIYHCVLIPDAIKFAELARALRHSDLCLSTDAASGCQVIHRKPTPPEAA